ncbi:MAG: tetratricopeptide repeat protein [Candidatus Eisenbacteria bacterium]|nr:tetratricopeptide repeat protein [Candidatus Eisenbacteria bacterium]
MRRNPAMTAAVAVVALLALLGVTYHIFDTDFWQHLLMGRAIWTSHAVATTQLWTWPTYGAPNVNASWGFFALIWPFWALGGVTGLFVWRWISILAVLGILWALGRRMGGRGFAALAIVVVAALVYRLRSQIRPETLVAILFAGEIAILERARLGGRDRTPWVIAIAFAWANAHISYYLGLGVLGIYLLDALIAGRSDAGARARARRLAITMAGAVAISFVNPFGGRALAQPFEYFFVWRHEPVYQTIRELQPVRWSDYADTTLPEIVFGWPLLILWRALRRQFDRVEIAMCAVFTALGLGTQRFIGLYALAATPFMMRDVDAWAATRRWPAWSVDAWVRSGAVIAICAGFAVAELRRADPRAGVGIDMVHYPVSACDAMTALGVRGRGFTNFEAGGYQAWRFWPDRSRLPFMDVHQAGTREDRRLYALAFGDPRAWRALDDERRFDYVLLGREREGGNPLLDVLDADSTWALIFVDDVAALYVRRHGPLAAVARRVAYAMVPAGTRALAPLGEAVARDSLIRRAVRGELERSAAASPWNAGASSLLANVALTEGRYEDAGTLLEHALRVNPATGPAHERLALARDSIAAIARRGGR